MSGPLSGVRVVELAGIGPGPFAAMVLADLGAEVLRVDRIGASAPDPARGGFDVMNRNRGVIYVDLKRPEGVELVLGLSAQADVVLEGFRPGVVERLGVGPADCLARNPRVIFGRMTGWGQDGPLADRAGHDINYASIGGALAHIGRNGAPPTPPLNLVADFGGGGMLLVVGVLAALVERAASGEGQVVDAAMVDGVALLMAPFWGAMASGFWNDERGSNMLDSGTPWYDCYRCADGGYVSVGAIEPQFYAELIGGLELDESWLSRQHDREGWAEFRRLLTERFGERSRDEWAAHFEGRDACVAPILPIRDAASHPHVVARSTVVDVDGAPQPAPAPRFGRTAADHPQPGWAIEGDAALALLARWDVQSECGENARAVGALR